MIKANELRIGNWVLDPVDGRMKTTNIYQIGKHQIDDTNTNYLPIPLTPEILERAGWIVVDQGSGEYWWNERAIWFHIIKNKEVGNLFANFNGNAVYIKYVHQLQNLYFALTGEELEVTL